MSDTKHSQKGYKMETLHNINTNIANSSHTIKTERDNRNVLVATLIDTMVSKSKEYKEVYNLSNKKAYEIAFELEDTKQLDTYTKRAFKVAKAIIKDGYKINYKLLSLSQCEHLTKFNKNLVNKLIVEIRDLGEDATQDAKNELYIELVKELINTAKITKTTKVFSAKVASEAE